MNIKKWWSGLTGKATLWKYHIDYPSAENGCPQDTTGWIIQGWLLLDSAYYAQVGLERTPYLSLKLNENLMRYVPLDKARPDVLNKVTPFNSKQSLQSQLYCGFRFSLPLSGARLPLRLHVGEQEHVLTEIHLPSSSEQTSDRVQAPLKVLHGKENWLFLDNDTNFSVDQHRGYLGLSQTCLLQWQRYIQTWQNQLQSFGNRALFVVAPTKESVLTQYYPYVAAKENLLSTIFDLMPDSMYLYPVPQLQALGDAAYYKTDTHWTHKGAQLTAALVAERVGIEAEAVQQVFAKDRYQSRNHSGDLGKKLSPPAAQPEEFLVGFSYRKWVVFDNGLPNFGRVLCIEYDAALIDATCLIFGSSSSYTMFNYFCRVFKRVVFVHTAGQIDPVMLQKIQPDYVIAQTNARFMVRPPRVDYDVLAMVKEKSQTLNSEQKEKITVVALPAKQALIQQLGLDRYLPVL